MQCLLAQWLLLESQQNVIVIARVKKANVDRYGTGSYMPIWKLPFMPKAHVHVVLEDRISMLNMLVACLTQTSTKLQHYE